MILIARNLSELADSVVGISVYCNAKGYPNEFMTYDEAWEQLRRSMDHLRRKLGNRHAQLLEMIALAKSHYDAEAQADTKADADQQGSLGSWLMQDIEQVVRGKPPFAYPAELYRWPRGAG